MVATIALMILAVMWGLAWTHLAGRPRLGAQLGALNTHANGADSIAAHDEPARTPQNRSAGAQVEPAEAGTPVAVPVPVRGKVVLFPSHHTGRASLLATAQGSRSLYVYWDPTRVGDAHLRTVLGEEDWQRTAPCLRVFDITVGGFPGRAGGCTIVVPLPERADHHIITEGIQPGHRYVISYERRTDDGQHYLLSQSAPVWLPPDSPPAGRTLHRLHARRPGKWSGSP